MNSNFTARLEEFKQRRENYNNIINAQILEGCNKIVKVNEIYTAGVDEDNKVILKNTPFPTQFTPEAADKIVKECEFFGTENIRVIPKVLFYKDWYRSQMESLNMLIEHIEANLD